MTLQSFEDVDTLLAQYIPRARSLREAYTLERMTRLMHLLGNPQNTFQAIHIAGTSGKTSTAYYVASILKSAGVRAGLMVSPHIDHINERVQIDLVPLPEKKFCERFGIFMDIITESHINPTYFELLVAFAYWVMAQEKIPYVVVEVGLGGLLDGTNVITNPNKVCIITDIGLDHTHILGHELPAIAGQKAGIIRSHNTVMMYEQSEEVMQVIREVSEREQAELHEIWPLAAKELPSSLPLFQRRNWYLALATYELLRDRHGLPDLGEIQLAESTNVYIPARMEVVHRDGKTIILDGAHNAQKLEALVQSLKAAYPRASFAVMLSLLQGKAQHLRGSLKLLLDITDHLIITTFDARSDVRKQSVSPLKLAEYCGEYSYDDWEIIKDISDAYDALLARDEDILLITGSFYLLAHVRRIMEQHPSKE